MVIITKISSKGQIVIPLEIREKMDLEEGNLFSECSIKCENILRIDKNIIMKKIGKIKKEKFDLIINKIFEIIK